MCVCVCVCLSVCLLCISGELFYLPTLIFPFVSINLSSYPDRNKDKLRRMKKNIFLLAYIDFIRFIYIYIFHFILLILTFYFLSASFFIFFFSFFGVFLSVYLPTSLTPIRINLSSFSFIFSPNSFPRFSSFIKTNHDPCCDPLQQSS